MSTLPHTDLPANLTDALARGRLCIGEVAGVNSEELDALFELGARHLDSGQNQDAVSVFGGLVALFPYTARHWRAYGVALQRTELWKEALGAYRAAALLDPDHLETRCYQAEVMLHLNQADQARKLLEEVQTSPSPELAERAASVVQHLPDEPSAPPEPPQGPAPAAETSPETQPHLELDDGRPLPLSPGAFEAATSAEAPPEPIDHWEGLLPSRPAVSDPVPLPPEQSHTAIVARRSLRDPAGEGSPEQTHTAIIPRSLLVPGGDASRKSASKARPPETSVVKRRHRLPLRPEHTQIMPHRFFDQDQEDPTP
ncbi:MAG: tetratricopeptide repeat protein [Myxococcota bacterium]|nr:tetratricopeptide repeat protein [Myxococcota bacterium]